MPILQIHLFRFYNSQHESDITRIEAVETERRSRLVYYRLNIFQTTTILQRYNFQSRVSNKLWTRLSFIYRDMFLYTDVLNFMNFFFIANNLWMVWLGVILFFLSIYLYSSRSKKNWPIMRLAPTHLINQ